MYCIHTNQLLFAYETTKFISWIYVLPLLENNAAAQTFGGLLLLYKKEKGKNVMYL
jgi:hypothetical protein